MQVFLSTPISCFENSEQLSLYKRDIKKLLFALKEKHSVCAEIENIANNDDYDAPEKSIDSDLAAIRECDVFIMHYPKRNPTSALIELGFAISEHKRIIIVVPQADILPFLALGIQSALSDSRIIESSMLDDDCIRNIMNIIES